LQTFQNHFSFLPTLQLGQQFSAAIIERMENLSDSLSQELGSAPRSRRIRIDDTNSDSSYSKVRPITTGVIDVKYGSSHLRNHNTEQFTDSTAASDSSGKSRVRPRAPLVGRRKGVNSGVPAHSTSTQATKKSTHTRNKSMSTATISEKWDNLQRFSQNNQGRSLGDQDVSSVSSSAGGGIHFVNVNNFSSADRQPDAARQSKDTASKVGGAQLHDSPSLDYLSLESPVMSSADRKIASKPVAAPKNTSNDRIFSKARDPVETKSGRMKSLPSTAFAIPELPAGKQLIINILSTWSVRFHTCIISSSITVTCRCNNSVI
jgi:hypothetical protein